MDNIIELMKSRRTIRKFRQTPLTKEQLESYIDAARVAPSAANLQPLKYIVVKSEQMRNKVFPLLKWAGYLENYAPKDDERPMAYIIICVDKNICQRGAELDVGAAAENIILSALFDNVGTCWLGSADKEKLSVILEIEENLSVFAVLALGYPKENPKETEAKTDIKYYLDGETLCVPKRSIDEVLLSII